MSHRSKPVRRRDDEGTHLPRWMTQGIVGSAWLALLVHIAADYFRTDYEGTPTSLMLGGLVGAAMASDRLNANRQDSGGEK